MVPNPHPHDRIVNLAHSFPALGYHLSEAGIMGGEDWTARVADFDEHVIRYGCGGARQAAAFVLGLWNHHGREWAVGRFELGIAMREWDRDHIAAFQDWAREPWLP